MSDDPEYDDLVRAEKKAFHFLQKNHYHHIDPDSCRSCESFDMGMSCEDENYCRKAETNDKWKTQGISEFGICDQYKGRK